MPQQKEIPIFTDEQIKHMLAMCDLTTAPGQRDYIIMLLFAETGMRLRELCKMHINDVYGTALRVQGKGAKEREIELAPVVSEQLHWYINHVCLSSQRCELFVNDTGQPLVPGNISRIVRDARKRAGINDHRLSAHTFRMTFAIKSFRSLKQS